MKKVNKTSEKSLIITGSAGFIGFHVAKYYLKKNWNVIGIDGITNYYDINLKITRHKLLSKFENFKKYEFLLENYNKLEKIFKKYNPNLVIHLAAQAGVRYSVENPRQYLDSNIIATFNILEISKKMNLKHLLISSTSSVYGDYKKKPFKEIYQTDNPLSFYAATKKSSEILAHSYSHLFKMPITIFRFFTVYGPWGRPDMALFKFTRDILSNKNLEIYNFGNMERDFTYIDDLVISIYKLSKKNPKKYSKVNYANDTLSDYGPYRIVNIGNSLPINLIDYIKIIENNLGIKAKKKFIKHQIGDVKSTWSDVSLLKSLINFEPKTDINVGIKKFIAWYLEYYKVK